MLKSKDLTKTIEDLNILYLLQYTSSRSEGVRYILSYVCNTYADPRGQATGSWALP